MSLLAALRVATGDLHRQVERSGLMTALLRGQFERSGYVALLRQLAALYEALEARLDEDAGDPLIAAIHDPRLARHAALAADLVHLHGPGWEQLPIAAPMQRCVRRLQQASAAQLLAHAYVRYLGDLAGGQILDRIIGKALALDGDQGRAFYRFPAPGAGPLAAGFRSGLDALSETASAAVRQRIVDEAVWAFRLHGELFAALDGDQPRSA